MSEPTNRVSRGRRGRRTALMVRIARERILDLFELAHREALGGDPLLADRYVHLARAIGARYNVRFLPEYRELYCRGCSAYWVEGRTVRTRLRRGHRVRTCLRCGRIRRIPRGAEGGISSTRPATAQRLAISEQGALVLEGGGAGIYPGREPRTEGQ